MKQQEFTCIYCKCTHAYGDAVQYEGLLGYRAALCPSCGAYLDEFGLHAPDDWSKEFLGLPCKNKNSSSDCRHDRLSRVSHSDREYYCNDCNTYLELRTDGSTLRPLFSR